MSEAPSAAGVAAPRQINVEVDGRAVQVPHGSTLMDAANKLGIYVPFFCYHRKLSIAANCRMCLVQVEKAPKPLPACATPVTEGMKAWTHSEQAIEAQKAVMEFLLINHPLDCPICDQGGECQLQDLAVGYGGSASRYREKKRVVFHKYMGPLISAEEMTRCIHCTRCVRFGVELAGVMELGMSGRGEHAEIQTFVGRSVDSELSGNMIDLCPVGALTSKPFRFAARSWELARRKSVSPHDGHGSNLIVQVKNDRVMRVLPLDNEAVNECWLSDKDRFSYEAVNGDERLTRPMLKQGGEWRSVSWQSALEFVANGLADIVARHGPASIGALLSPHSTLEEMTLAARLVRGLGSDNVDFRLRQTDFRDDRLRDGIPALGLPIAGVAGLDRALVIGAFLRKDQPLLALRLRQAAKKGAQVSSLHSVADDWLLPLAHQAIVPPSQLPMMLAQIVVAAAQGAGKDAPPALRGIEPGAAADVIAASLLAGSRRAILLGNYAVQHPAGIAARGAGAGTCLDHRVDAWRLRRGREQRRRIRRPRMAPSRRPLRAGDARRRGRRVAPRLPAAACRARIRFRESRRRARGAREGGPRRRPLGVSRGHPVRRRSAPDRSVHRNVRYVCELRGPRAVVSRCCATGRRDAPAWKVLRVLGTMLQLPGFEFDSSDAVRDAVLAEAGDLGARLSVASRAPIEAPARGGGGLERVADVPIYFADPLVRRAPSLQATADAKPPRARVNRTLLDQLAIEEGAQIRVRQGRGEAVLATQLDPAVPPGVVRIAAAHPSTCGLEGLSGPISVERA